MQVKQAYAHLLEHLIPLYGEGEARSISRIVMEDAFGVYNFFRAEILTIAAQQKLEVIISRLARKEPVQYVLGMADFYGLKFKVNPDVLIPRQETEELVHWIIEAHKKTPSIRILDIGTGSACIAVSLKKQLPQAEVWALDVSAKALAIARQNAESNGVEIQFVEADILAENTWQDLPKFDIIVSNPPYITRSEQHLMPDWVLNYEPPLALFVAADADALIFYKKIAKLALQKLNTKGQLYYEINEFYGKQAKAMLEKFSFQEVILQKDMEGKDRMIRVM